MECDNGAVCDLFLRAISLPTVASSEMVALVACFASVAIKIQKRLVEATCFRRFQLCLWVDSGEVAVIPNDLSLGCFRFVLPVVAILADLVGIGLSILIPTVVLRSLVGFLPPPLLMLELRLCFLESVLPRELA